MNAKGKKTSVFLLFFICIIYIGLPLSILAGLIDFDYKFYALTIGSVVVYGVFRLLGFSNADMGITFMNTKKSIIHVMPLTIVLVIAGVTIWLLGYSRITPNEKWSFFIFYIFISSPVQEFLYRGSLEAALNKFKLPYWGRMVLSTALYSFVHIIYRDWLTLVLTFAIGLIWYFCYQKTKNLIGVSISHAVLGVVTIVAGIIN